VGGSGVEQGEAAGGPMRVSETTPAELLRLGGACRAAVRED
jgi:hypothetical protein